MFEKKRIKEEIIDIEAKLSEQDVWNDHNKSNKLLKRKNSIQKFLDNYINLNKKFQDLVDLITLSEKESETDLLNESILELKNLNLLINSLYIETLMNGQADSKDAFLEIHSGAGGTESQDWAAMIFRMYSRWCESKNLKFEIIDQTDGEGAGYKSITIKISGDKSYGWLKKETGIHRLVRISPFDSQSRRHTSFASVSCYPVVDNAIKIQINEKDIRIDTFRASGAGGQHVNKTDSAVRITHLPSKIIVQCQSNRSQHRNKNIAMEMLKSKLYELEITKEEEKNQKDRDNRSQISWGNQIRSYVMQPYQMVKDHRTNYEESNVNSILDGKIDRFLEEQLIKLV